jgi:hypothetical protein
MTKRSIAMLLLVSMTLYFAGCKERTVQHLTPPEVPHPETEQIVGVTTATGEDVKFDPPGASVKGDTLTASVSKAPFQISLSKVQRFWIMRQEVSKARTIGLVAAVAVGTVVVIAAVVAATKQSCPFVYSWDGNQFVFDAEPYGGAITRGLEKDDYTQLEHLRVDHGFYWLKITNEVDETQLTNLMELWVVDHPAGSLVVADTQGKLHTLEAPQSMLSARDQEGHDLLPWLRATDRVIWEQPAVADPRGNLQNEIVMTFPKPEGATQVKLLANAATGLWGSYMIKKMVELRGRDVGAWYRIIDESPAARDQLFAWELKEQLYALKIYIEEPTGWEVRGFLPGTGPFISKDRVVPLDVSRVRGNQLRISIRPPAGFWALNSFAVDYSLEQPVSVKTVAPLAARDSHDKDVLPELLTSDDRYYEMPNIGDSADISFPAPARRAGMDRTVILHSRGYYRLHLAEGGEPDLAALDAITNVPGAAARFAANRFAEWQAAGRGGQ